MAASDARGDSVPFEVKREAWCVVKILDDDGTVIELKPVLTDVRRTDQRDEQGRPVYRLTAAVVARMATAEGE